MALKIDYYAMLSQAVAALDRESYAARGAVYDREHKAMMRRLFSADPPLPDEDIEREQARFRAAVRRIEFGDEDPEQIPLVPQRDARDEAAAARAIEPPTPAATIPEPHARNRRAEPGWTSEPVAWSPQSATREPPRPPAAEPPRPPTGGPAAASPTPADPAATMPAHGSQRKVSAEIVTPAATHWSQRKPSQPLPWRELEATVETALQNQAAPPPPEVTAGEPTVDAEKLKRRPIFGRILRRVLLALVLLALGIVGYRVAVGDVEIPGLANFTSRDDATVTNPAATTPSQAIIFDSNPPNTEGSKAVGTAVWRVQSEPASAQRPAATVLQFNLKIPDRRLNLAMSMRPETSGSPMSHLIELKFLRDDGQPDSDIDNIASIVMTTVEQQRPHVLAGQVQKVAPGVFWFGLRGQASDREQNMRFLTEDTWFDIPLTYRNGASGVLAVEKGANGEQAIKDAVSEWGRVAATPADR
jgi:hypothetical protein